MRWFFRNCCQQHFMSVSLIFGPRKRQRLLTWPTWIDGHGYLMFTICLNRHCERLDSHSHKQVIYTVLCKNAQSAFLHKTVYMTCFTEQPVACVFVPPRQLRRDIHSPAVCRRSNCRRRPCRSDRGR